KQIGISLVKHDGGPSEPTSARKTTLHPVDNVSQNILQALTTLAAAQPQPVALDGLLVESLLHACLHLLTSPAAPHPRKAARSYEAICLYVEENLQSPISRASVARTFALTPNHVSRLFHREGNTRFIDYLTQVRIERAKFMLREYASGLKEIAAHCGFRDVSYFCRVFNRLTKITPTEFRLRGP